MRSLLLALAVAACQPIDSRVADKSSAELPNLPTEVESSEEIAGRWDIVSFEGYRPVRMMDAVPAAFAEFTDDGVALRIECNYSGAAGEVRDDRWVSRPHDELQTAMACGPERHSRERRLFSFFDLEPSAEKLPNGRLRFVAEERELILERPEVRRLDYRMPPNALEGEWRLEMVHLYHEKGGYSGIGLSEIPGRLRFESGHAYYTQCEDEGIFYRYGEDGLLRKVAEEAAPTPSDCPVLVSENEHARLPRAFDVLIALHSDPFMERVGKDRMLMATDRVAVTLTKSD